MSVTVDSFVASHPEFREIAAAHPTMVSTALADAVAETDATVCGAETDRIVRLRAADALDVQAGKQRAKARSLYADALDHRRDAAELMANGTDPTGDGEDPEVGPDDAPLGNGEPADDEDTEALPAPDDIDALLEAADELDASADAAVNRATKLDRRAAKLRAGVSRAAALDDDMADVADLLKRASAARSKAARTDRQASTIREDVTDPDTGEVDEDAVADIDAFDATARKLRAKADRFEAQALKAVAV